MTHLETAPDSDSSVMALRKILLVEDDRTTAGLVKAALKADFQVQHVGSISECQALLQNEKQFALIIIDRSLPDGDGISLCTELRQTEALANTPVVFLTAKDSESDKVSGFFAGADDYITKPFGPLELKARVMARLRTQQRKLTAGRLHLDVDGFRAYLENGEQKTDLGLTPIEFKILMALMQNLDEVLSREALLTRVWGDQVYVNDRVVDSHISHLRKKLKTSDFLLESLRGEGYRLTPSAKPSQAA